MASETSEKHEEIVLSGELNIHTIKNIGEKLNKYLDTPLKSITLNLERVTVLDTATLQLLLAFKKAAEKKSTFKTIKVNPNIVKILKLSGLENEFKEKTNL